MQAARFVPKKKAVVPAEGHGDDGAIVVEPLAPKVGVGSAPVDLFQNGAGLVDVDTCTYGGGGVEIACEP